MQDFIILSIWCSRISKKKSELSNRIFDHLFIKKICLWIQMKNYIKNKKMCFLPVGFYEQRNYISNCQRMWLIRCTLLCFEISKLVCFCWIMKNFLNNWLSLLLHTFIRLNEIERNPNVRYSCQNLAIFQHNELKKFRGFFTYLYHQVQYSKILHGSRFA